MPNPEFGVKVTPELKERIHQLIKDANLNTNKEWFEHVISIYEMHLLKHSDGTKRYADDLESIQQHLTRVQETIVQIIKKSNDTLNHQETSWKINYEELKQQLQTCEETRSTLNNQLTDSVALAKQHKNELEELRKQFSIHETLGATLANSLKDKESELEGLRHERNQWNNLNYPAEIQRLKDENQSLQQQLQNQQHKMALLEMEYKHKLELEQFKASTALLHRTSTRLKVQDNQTDSMESTDSIASTSRKRGRPRKDSPSISVSGLEPSPNSFFVQIEHHDLIASEEDESEADLFEDQEPYIPETDEYMQHLQDLEQTDDDQQLEEPPPHEQEHADKT